MDSESLVVFVTAPVGELPTEIAHALVSEKLAACVNILPQIRSIYFWKHEVCDDPEQLLVIKTTRERYPALETRVRELHSYEVAEVIALPIVKGSAPYLSWLADCCAP